MKKQISILTLSLCLILSFATSADAQSRRKRVKKKVRTAYSQSASEVEWGLGGHLGLSWGNTSITPDVPTESRTGIMIGARGHLRLKDSLPHWLSFQPELSYVQKGAETLSVNSSTLQANLVTIKANYLELALLGRATYGDQPLKPAAFFGPAFGFELSATSTSKVFNSTSSASTATTTDLGSRTNAIDFGFILGGGVEYEINRDLHLVSDLRYYFGLTDMDNTPGVDFKNRAVQLLAGVRFML